MSPAGGNYSIKIPISFSGDAQLQRILDNIKALRSEVSALAVPLRVAAADSGILAASFTAIATGSRAASNEIQKLTALLREYSREARQAAASGEGATSSQSQQQRRRPGAAAGFSGGFSGGPAWGGYSEGIVRTAYGDVIRSSPETGFTRNQQGMLGPGPGSSLIRSEAAAILAQAASGAYYPARVAAATGGYIGGSVPRVTMQGELPGRDVRQIAAPAATGPFGSGYSGAGGPFSQATGGFQASGYGFQGTPGGGFSGFAGTTGRPSPPPAPPRLRPLHPPFPSRITDLTQH